MAIAPLQLNPDRFPCVINLTGFQNRVDRATQSDQCATGYRGGTFGQRLEHEPRAVVIQQNPAIQITHHHRLRQLRHQGGQTVLLFFDIGFRLGHLRFNIVNEGVALCGQVVNSADQFTQFRRPFFRDTERAIRAQHQAQLFHHRRHPGDIAIEQATQQNQAKDKARRSQHAAQRHLR